MSEAVATPGTRLAREYETVVILKSDTDDDGVEKANTRLAAVIEKNAGGLVAVDVWGKKKLAYPIKHDVKGVYCYFKYLGESKLVAEVERNLRMWDDVLKYQTVRIADDVDYAAKMATVLPEHVQLRKKVADADEVPAAPLPGFEEEEEEFDPLADVPDADIGGDKE
ncbi:MAG TPA: 30S ribosomal protein S6 [Myxococcota bacterium]|jgi:small subunit ribosomal protein S6|nr:30S ribosomal protein S6 [Myxococcota bacterium]